MINESQEPEINCDRSFYEVDIEIRLYVIWFVIF